MWAAAEMDDGFWTGMSKYLGWELGKGKSEDAAWMYKLLRFL